MKQLIRVVAPQFVAGAIFNDAGVCVKAAPKLKESKGQKISRCAAYWRRMGYRFRTIDRWK